jgi:hypothetical protein
MKDSIEMQSSFEEEKRKIKILIKIPDLILQGAL